MSELKHTPGPWGMRLGGWHGGERAYWIEDEARQDPRSIAGVPRIMRDEAHWQANARLIAAAPDLLKASEMALKVLEHSDIWYTTQAQLRDAIGKARSE